MARRALQPLPVRPQPRLGLGHAARDARPAGRLQPLAARRPRRLPRAGRREPVLLRAGRRAVPPAHHAVAARAANTHRPRQRRGVRPRGLALLHQGGVRPVLPGLRRHVADLQRVRGDDLRAGRIGPRRARHPHRRGRHADAARPHRPPRRDRPHDRRDGGPRRGRGAASVRGLLRVCSRRGTDLRRPGRPRPPRRAGGAARPAGHRVRLGDRPDRLGRPLRRGPRPTGRAGARRRPGRRARGRGRPAEGPPGGRPVRARGRPGRLGDVRRDGVGAALRLRRRGRGRERPGGDRRTGSASGDRAVGPSLRLRRRVEQSGRRAAAGPAAARGRRGAHRAGTLRGRWADVRPRRAGRDARRQCPPR